MWQAYRYGPTAFYAQQSLEKLLKGAIVEFSNKRPPKIHDLLRLKEESGLKIPEKWDKNIKLLTRHYYMVRYPDLTKKYTGSRKK